jgi:hypothetical protein
MGFTSWACSLIGPVGWAFSGCREAYKEESGVGTMQWLAGIGEMVGGGVLAIFGAIELGETVLTGGGTLGNLLGLTMLGGGGFLLADGHKRSSDINWTTWKTINLGKGCAEVIGGSYLFLKGIESAYETYNGQEVSYFEGGLALVGLGGGGYLLWDGHKRVVCSFYQEYCEDKKKVKEVLDRMDKAIPDVYGKIGGGFLKDAVGDAKDLKGLANNLAKSKEQRDKEKGDKIKKAQEDWTKIIGGIFTRAAQNTGGEVPLKDLPTGPKRRR